jgi:hypothetical protein
MIRAGSSACAAGALLLLVTCFALTDSVRAQSSASIAPSLSPDRLHARGALTLTVLSNGALGGLSPVRRAILRLPPGLELQDPALRSCSAARLRARGSSGCPAQSRIGGGHALVEARAGSQLIAEHIDLSVFVGAPQQDLEPTFEVLGEGFTPLQERIVLSGAAAPSHAPYGEELVMDIPPIPTLPLEPDASLVSLTLTVGATARPPARDANAVVMPGHCPAGGFPFAAEFTFADATTSSAAATAPCPATKSN